MRQSQRALVERARSVGGSDFAVPLSDAACCYLLWVVASDLDLPLAALGLPSTRPSLFTDSNAPAKCEINNLDFWQLVTQVLGLNSDADTYFSCLAMLHKCRLKYVRILECQPLPTIDQVGPRGLLQYGLLSDRALSAFLMWRKWMFDIDNRAAQETGYLFEPIIAHSIGGTPVSAGKSPIRRQRDHSKGRQVDCIRDKRAYEIKLRVTVAASGQGRWQEEMDFPSDARASGYTPVLVIFDPTKNKKQDELRKAFLAAGGDVYIGADAWSHLATTAGSTMAVFIDKYVRMPIASLLRETNTFRQDSLPKIEMKMTRRALVMSVGGGRLRVARRTDDP